MKIIVNTLDLNDAVAKVSKALPAREVTPVLECIKITASNDKMTLYATDKDLAIEKTIDANVIVSGEFLVPGKLLGEYLRNIVDIGDEVSLEMGDSNELVISSAGGECKFMCMNVSDYPEEDTIDNSRYFVVEERALREAINKVIFAVATDESRPMLKGVYFEAKEYTLTAVATDGYRLAISKTVLEEKVDYITATIPSRSLSELSKLLEDSDNVVKVYVENNYLMVVLDSAKLHTRLLINGQYIKYDNLIPKEFVSTVIVNKENFERSLNTASIMSRADKNNLVLIETDENCMEISSSSQYGHARETVSISLNGKDIRSAYNAKYINDCLKALTAETIKMEFAQHNSCVITVYNSDEVLYFILPVKQL